MFSQLRNAVEQLAQQPLPSANRSSVSSESSTRNAHPGDTQRSPTGSVDEGRRSLTLSSPSQLAESALLNFRKNLISSRGSSPGPSQMPEKENTIARQNRSLEERLRASFTLGDASERTTPDASKATTPGEVEPASIALPLSPVQESTIPPSIDEAFDPLGASLSPTPSRSTFSPSPTAVEVEKPLTEKIESGRDQPSDEIQDFTSEPNLATNKPPLPLPSPRLDIPDEASPLPDVSDDPGSDHTVTASLKVEQVPPEPPIPGPVAPVALVPVIGSLEPATPVYSRPLTPSLEEKDLDVEKLRERLKLVEQRFSDVSTSFKRLQAEKRAADELLKQLTPLESISDVEGLGDHLKNLKMKMEMSKEEIRRLNGKLQQQDTRLDEFRDTHRLETASQSEQIERLQKQVSEAEALLKASEEISTKSNTELEKLRSELEKTKGIAKEEEEKRTKAISLLKTVRAKLVKAEREKEDAAKEMAVVREREKEERERERIDRTRLEVELERARLDKDRELVSLRAQFEKEMSALKDRYERENAARRGQFELEAITTKAAHTKEMVAKNSRISSLEASVRTLSEEKDVMFDQLQMRQAELESSQSHLDSVEARSTELQYQLREAEGRIELLTEELTDVRSKVVNGLSSGPSAEELARVLSETEGKYEARISDLRGKMRGLEKERHEAEDEWGRNLQERSREIERLRRLVEGKDKEYAESIRTKTEMEERIMALEADNRKLNKQNEAENGILLGLQKDIEWLKNAEVSIKQERDEGQARLDVMAKQLEESKVRENTLKSSNKAIREELRKVQASAALLERQRNPGIGYWSASSRMNGFTQSAIDLQNPRQSSRNSVDEASISSSTRPSSPTPNESTKGEEEVNIEYIRNVILQFLEHKEMRPNLVRVLSIILHFTPQETRRLIAKV